MRAALLLLLVPAFLLLLSNTARGEVDSAGSIPTQSQTRYLGCPGVPATVNGNSDMDVKTVTKSSLECSILCSLRKQCWGVTVCASYGEGKDGVVCEMWVSGVPFTQCPQGSGYIGTDCRFLLKNAGLCTRTGNAPVTEMATTITGDAAMTEVTTTITDDAAMTEVTTTMTGDTPVTEVTTTMTGDTPVTEMTTTIAGDTPVSEMTTTDAAATTTMLVCQNGGTVKGTSCRCPLPYGGQTCQRYMRDCTEGFEHKNTNNGAYFIQPVGSPNAFKVRCNFQVAIGVTQVMTRKDMPGQWHDKTWQQVKDGFGDNLVTTPNSWNFFIGLENLHHISRQALYSFHIFFFWGSNKDGCASYKNFTVGPESSGYKMDYDTFYKLTNPGEVNYLLAQNQADDGFNNTAPRSFSASDNDLNSCFTTTGAVGWYNSNCQGISLFSDTLHWPVGGQNKTLLWVMLNLVRESDYY